jgi:triacylglycerol lipase
MPKPLPAPLDLIPPNEGEYRYFEHPLDPVALGFDLLVAAWMADAAMLAYSDAGFAARTFREAAGVPGQVTFGHAAPGAYSTQCFVAHSDRIILVAFRGTEVLGPRDVGAFTARLRSVLRDVEVDARLRLMPYEGGGRVHGGFLGAVAEVWRDLEGYLRALRRDRPERPVWFTGHSLGGALATLAADHYARRVAPPHGVYTFGSPAVGDAGFGQAYRAHGIPTFRVVHHHDVIARVPLRVSDLLPEALVPPYEPVGTPVYLPAGGARVKGTVPDLGLRTLLDELPGVDDAIRLLTASGDEWVAWLADALPGDLLTDHAPIYYAVYLWNLWERSITRS